MSARLGAVVLAAGGACRFGGGKLTAVWRGKPLIAWAVDVALDVADGPVVVVIGDRAEALRDALPATGRLKTVFATDHALGLAHSLCAGLAALPDDLAGAFVLLGDMPAIPAAIATGLAAALGDGVQAAAPVFNGRRGHPVLFDRTLFPHLMALTGDRGAGALLASLGDGLGLVDVTDPGVLFDIDTQDDLESELY